MADYPVSCDFSIPGLNMKGHLTGTVTLSTSVVPPKPDPPKPDPTGPMGLADRVVGVYFPHWEPRRLKDRPKEINTVYLAFAIGTGEGAVQFAGLNTLDKGQFIADIKELRGRGVSVILSVGGEGSPIALDNDTQVNNLVASVDKIYKEWGGFDGLDWDVEAPAINPSNFAAASRKLKAKYGQKFAICMSFAGNVAAYKELARDLERTDEVDLVVIQYYDYQASQQERRAGVLSRTRELVNTYSINPSHIGIGVKFAGDEAMVWTVPSILEMWQATVKEFPSLGGVVVWDSLSSSQVPAGDEFLQQVAPEIAVSN